jgi:hypothetical protein
VTRALHGRLAREDHLHRADVRAAQGDAAVGPGTVCLVSALFDDGHLAGAAVLAIAALGPLSTLKLFKLLTAEAVVPLPVFRAGLA